MKDYIDIDNVNNFTFETCDISRVTRRTHHSIDTSQSSQILELLHADLCGPINIESYGGAKYFICEFHRSKPRSRGGSPHEAFLRRRPPTRHVPAG
ncbi:retrovirus-related Pol polyprotein from transposon TNT 1-94 [Trichonephila clavipes]|nr:retrovirus-related Pol polyprotein from transposon TNT 1-94 [Trichonephila clavipes]